MSNVTKDNHTSNQGDRIEWLRLEDTAVLGFPGLPERELVAIVLGDSVGGAAARRLLPDAFLVPVVRGWSRLESQRGRSYGFPVRVL